jgi:hypothetical protein
MKAMVLSGPLLAIAFGSAACLGEEVAEPVGVRVKKQHAAKAWTECGTTLLEHLRGFEPRAVALSRYGGRADRREEASGFFRTRKTGMGWVLVDPGGCRYFSVGVCSTAPNDQVPDTREIFAERFADRSDWARRTHDLLVNDLHFNSLGCWSDWRAFHQAGIRMPYVRHWNLLADYARKRGLTFRKYGHAGFRGDVLPVFDEGFAKHCDEACRAMAETRDDPWLIGHFSDNELPFKSDGMLKRYLADAAGEESRAAALRFLRERGIDRGAIDRRHDTAFAERVMLTYYRTVHDAIRRHDPNHLILGSRLHGLASGQDICYSASGPFVDVVSINYYNRWTPDARELDRRAALAGKPILITEWYAKGADSGLDNTKGAGFTVPTQRDRGRFYENFTIGLLRNRNVVGWHWFRYIDDGDLKTKGRSSNKGIVNLKYEPYRELTHSMRAVNSQVDPLSDFLRGDKSPAPDP